MLIYLQTRIYFRMIILITICMTYNPFLEGNFTASAVNASALFENPACLGRELTAEAMFTQHRDTLISRLALNRFGFSLLKYQSSFIGEAGIGLKAPGVFAFGYGLRFGISNHDQPTTHYIGLLGKLASRLNAGCRLAIQPNTIGLTGGLSFHALSDRILIAADAEYQPKLDYLDYHWGIRYRAVPHLNLCFDAFRGFADYHAGLEVHHRSLGVTAAYSFKKKRLSAGLLVRLEAR